MVTTESLTYQRKYTLSSTELDILSRHLRQFQPPKTNDQFVYYLLNGTDEVSNIACYDMFQLDDAEMESLAGVYEHVGMFFVVIDTIICRPAGVARVVENSSTGIPSLNDAPKYIGVSLDKFIAHHKVENLDKVWDSSTVVVLKEYRRVEENLLHMGVWGVAIADKHFRTVFSPLGFMGESIVGTGPVEHSGSADSVFVYGHRPAIIRHIAESVNKVDHRLSYLRRDMLMGGGLDHHFMFQFSKIVEYGSTRKQYAKL
ncbi:hypothetical protein DL96DRAFT_1744348 [Flagelloscypha sp. PMI_526]|nr:hypothetical protein DL96DRAFT_1744348 [Flagelloscypha sp. PMI_526]